MALFPASRFIVSVGGCTLVSAEPVVIAGVLIAGVAGAGVNAASAQNHDGAGCEGELSCNHRALLGFHPSTSSVFAAALRIYENEGAKRRFLLRRTVSCSTQPDRSNLLAQFCWECEMPSGTVKWFNPTEGYVLGEVGAQL
jgi:hypothetical protein